MGVAYWLRVYPSMSIGEQVACWGGSREMTIGLQDVPWNLKARSTISADGLTCRARALNFCISSSYEKSADKTELIQHTALNAYCR